MTASDEDLIRRGDALRVVRYGNAWTGAYDEIKAIPAVQVAVKPLEWKWSDRVQGWRADCELTRDVFIAYQTNEKWSAGSQWFGTTYHQTEADAKSHLDQMRAARIRSELTAQPSPEQVTAYSENDVQALVEALESIRKASLCSGSRETARAALARVKGGAA